MASHHTELLFKGKKAMGLHFEVKRNATWKKQHRKICSGRKLFSPEAIDCALFQLVRKFGGRLFMIASANYSDNLCHPHSPPPTTMLLQSCANALFQRQIQRASCDSCHKLFQNNHHNNQQLSAFEMALVLLIICGHAICNPRHLSVLNR